MDDNPHHHHHFLSKNSLVEVTSTEDGFTGAWYSATVIHPPPSISSPNHHRNNLVYVEYNDLLSDDNSSTRLREYAKISLIRPAPVVSDTNCYDFQLNDLVDAFYKDGWWTGVITAVLDGSNFVVRFQNPSEEIQFRSSNLRVHKVWDGCRWIQPQKQGTAGWMFTVGKNVEVCFDREGLRDVWFPATVLKSTGDSSFLVEYQQPGAGGEAVVHKVTVDYHHIRPSPPHLKDKNFEMWEKVDAYYDFGWWSGQITKELADNRYNVYFKHTKKEREFIYSRVRPHLEWKGGKWFNTSQGDSVVRTTHSLIENQIEQATPVISKQSPVSTSTMKTRQKNLDSNDKSLSKDEIMNASSKENKHQCVGQSEGFDSEASGLTGQAFSKTENLSHGKKVRSKRGKSIEVNTPTTDSSKKRGKLTNELKSLQVLAEESKVDSAKTRTQVIAEKNDATKNLPPVVMGLQKLPNEKTPDLAKSDTKQLLAPLKVANQEGNEGDAASVAPKRKRGRPPKLQALSPKTPAIVNHENVSVVPSTHPVVEEGQRKEGGLTTSSGAESLEENQGHVNEKSGVAGKQNDQLIKDKLPNENTGQDLHLKWDRGTKKYSARKGKRGKRRTISINTESQAQDPQDASKEKADRSLKKDSTRRDPEASVGKSMDIVSDDRPLSRWFEGNNSQDAVHGPGEKQLAIVPCDMDSGNLPFARTTPLWKTIESMEVFQKLPQNPHFRPLLEGVREGAREGLAIGTMVTFSTVVDKTCSLRFGDPRSTIEDCLETLVELENNGFDVEVIGERLTGLLNIKDKQEELEKRSKDVFEKINEHNIQGKKTDEEIEEIDRQIRELEERRKEVVLKKEKRVFEICLMEAENEEIEQKKRDIGAEFDGLAAAPFVSNNK